MAFAPVQLIGDDALKTVLNKQYWLNVVGHLNLLHAGEIKLPSTAWGSAKVLVSGTGVIFDFTRMKLPVSSLAPIQRMQLIDATSVGSPAVRVRLGYIADGLADPSMSDPTDDPPFVLPLAGPAGVVWIYATLPMSYSTANGVWTAFASTGIGATSTMPTNDATHFYIPIGAVNIVSNGTGGYFTIPIVPQPVDGDVWVARIQTGTGTYADYYSS